MNPWTIIGWGWVVITVIIGLVLARFLIHYVSQASGNWVRYLKTRDIPPAQGQKWWQDNEFLCIDRITETGRIVIRAGNTGWSDSPEDWKIRVRNRKLWLADPPSAK